VTTPDEFEAELWRLEALLIEDKISLYDFIKGVRLVYENALIRARAQRRIIVKYAPVYPPPIPPLTPPQQSTSGEQDVARRGDLKKCPKCGETSYYVTIPWEAWGICQNPQCRHEEVHPPVTPGWNKLYELKGE